MSPGLSLLTAWEKVVLDLRKQSLFFDQFFICSGWYVVQITVQYRSFSLAACLSCRWHQFPWEILEKTLCWNSCIFGIYGYFYECGVLIQGIADNYSCGFRKWWRTKYQENTCHTGSQWQSQTSRQKIICYQNPVFCMLVCADFDSNTLNGTLFLHLFIHDVWVFLLMNEMLCFPAMFSIFTEWYL